MRGQVLVSLDLELTSPRPEAQEIIEVAAVKFVGERVVDVFSTLVSPPAGLPYSIQVLTGITPDELAGAPKLEAVAPRLTAFVGDAPLVAHSVGLDVDALARKGVHLANPQVDTFELASILVPQLESYSLASLVRYFGIQQPTQHRALADAQVTRLLFLRLLERASSLDAAILREINALTAPLMWPLKWIFQAIEEVRGRAPEAGTSIRAALAAKMGAGEASLDAVLARENSEPLRPLDPRRPIDVERVAGTLRRGGPLARALPSFEEREPQIDMLRAVAHTLNDGGSLVVEAGTGTGKSLAYLIPAVAFSLENEERVVVSTNTINLQEQLFLKDLPDLRRALGREFQATILKGRQNYLCFQRWQSLRQRADLTMSEILTLVKILVWLPQTETGDVGELNLTEPERAVWTRLNSSPEVCSPRRCTAVGKRGCFLQYARERAAASHIVVVNHALLLSDVASESGVIPDYRYLVVDEAHHLEAQATDQLGYVVRLRDVVDYLDGLAHTSSDRRTGVVNELGHYMRGSRVPPATQREAEGIAQRLSAAVEAARTDATTFFAAATTFLKAHGTESRGYDQRTRFTPALRRQPAWAEVEIAWDDLAVRLAGVQAPSDDLLALLNLQPGMGIADYETIVGQLVGATRFNEQLRTHGAAIVANPDPERIYWGSVAGGELSLHSAPLHVGDLLRSTLFERKEACILTSATLATDGGFRYVRERLGLTDGEELLVGSPFDFASAALMYLPTDVPEPDRPDYTQALARSLIDVCTASQGRALVLFTAHSQLRQTWQAIRGPLESRGILVLGHGVDGTPRRHLLQSFKTNPRTVLLGASSFWEGIDVIGDQLSVLAIAKLPFAVPTDPVFAARSELFQDPFGEYSLPATILRFKQGFGRLIRSRDDRGVVVCYDRRLLTKSYGAAFLRSLPPAQVKRGTLAQLPTEVTEWLDAGARPPPAATPARG